MAQHGPVTEVPDVCGLDAPVACALVRDAGLVPYGPEMSAEPSSGVITAQAPIGAAGAERGTAVVLWADSGGAPADPGPLLDTDELAPA